MPRVSLVRHVTAGVWEWIRLWISFPRPERGDAHSTFHVRMFIVKLGMLDLADQALPRKNSHMRTMARVSSSQ